MNKTRKFLNKIPKFTGKNLYSGKNPAPEYEKLKITIFY